MSLVELRVKLPEWVARLAEEYEVDLEEAALAGIRRALAERLAGELAESLRLEPDEWVKAVAETRGKRVH